MSRQAASQPPRRTVVERVGWVPFACVIGALLLVGASGLTWLISPYYGRNGHQTQRPHSVGVVPVAKGTFNHQVAPHRIVIPKLHAQAPIVKVGTTPDGELQIPLDPKVVGWWSPGAKPGAGHGTAIFAGHINYAGVTGTLSDIGALHPGDRVKVFGRRRGHRAELTLSVTGVRTYHKTHLPYRRIFDQHTAGRVVIVTCGGPFDATTGNYLDNVVAYAVPIAHHRHPLTP